MKEVIVVLAPQFQQRQHLARLEVIAMRPFISSFGLVCLAAFAATAAQAETGILRVKVLNLNNSPIPKVGIAVEGAGSTGVTDDRGLARIKLAPQTRPGTWVTLEVSGGDYAFVSPWNRKVLVPPFRSGSKDFVTVYLTARGDQEALQSGKLAVAMAAKFNAALTPKFKDENTKEVEPTTEEERKTVLAEVARSFGLTPEESDRAIREWGEKAVDPYDKGVIALYQENYQEATNQLSSSYEMRKPNFKKAPAEMVEVAVSLGQSYYMQGDYREAGKKLLEANSIRNDDASTVLYLIPVMLQTGYVYDANPVLSRALAVLDKSPGPDHIYTARYLANVTLESRFLDGAKAVSLAKRAIAITEKTLGADHPETATRLDNLAEFYKSQNKYAEAEPPYKRALAICEKAFGADHPSIVTSLKNLADLYRYQRKYAEAEPLFKRILDIREKSLGADHMDTINSIGDLGELYRKQRKYAEAEPLFERLLAGVEKIYGIDNPDLDELRYVLVSVYGSQGKYAEAESLAKRILSISEKSFGVDDPKTAGNIDKIARIYSALGKYADAETFFKRALSIREKSLGDNHAGTIASLDSLAEFYREQGRYAEAESRYKRVLAHDENALSAYNPDADTNLKGLKDQALKYKAEGNHREAMSLLKLASAERRKALSSYNLNISISLEKLASVYELQGKRAEARPLYERALALREKALGALNPRVLESMGEIIGALGNSAQAEMYFRQALAVREKTLGAAHPDVATVLEKYASLLRKMNRDAEALKLEARAKTIRAKAGNK